jgi:hypothetical protein
LGVCRNTEMMDLEILRGFVEKKELEGTGVLRGFLE